MNKVLTILISGPYRSGTGNDPVRMKRKLRKLEDTALILFRAGHAFPSNAVKRPIRTGYVVLTACGSSPAGAGRVPSIFENKYPLHENI